MANTISFNPAAPERAFSRCREVIRAGGVIVYPAETLYGLGADPRNAQAVQKIFEIKGRPEGRPILILIGSRSAAAEWAADVPASAEVLMDRFWPGALTLVFRARAGVAKELTAGTGTIGLRVPGSRLTMKLLEFIETPLTGTSANVSGRPGARTAEEASEGVGSMVDLILDGGRTEGGLPSTVLDVTISPPRVIRAGAVSDEELRKYIEVVS